MSEVAEYMLGIPQLERHIEWIDSKLVDVLDVAETDLLLRAKDVARRELLARRLSLKETPP